MNSTKPRSSPAGSPQLTQETPSHNWAAPNLPDKLSPNSLTALPTSSQTSQGAIARSSLTPSAVPVTTLAPTSSLSTPAQAPATAIAPTTADESHPIMSPPASSPVASPLTASQPPLVTPSPSLPKPHTVTRRGRVVRRPARYSD